MGLHCLTIPNCPKSWALISWQFLLVIVLSFFSGPRSAVGNVSGYRCVSDCNSSSIPARSHTFVEIDHEIISTVILHPSADSFKKGCCQLQAKVCAQVLVNRLFKPAQAKVWLDELTVPQ